MLKSLRKRILIVLVVLAVGWAGLTYIEYADFSETSSEKKPTNVRSSNEITAVSGKLKRSGKKSATTREIRPLISPPPSVQKAKAGIVEPTESRSVEFNPSDYDPATDFIKNELLILEPPDGFINIVAGMGFVILEQTPLTALELMLVRLRVPAGVRTDVAQRQLLGRFPDLTVDVNHILEASQDRSKPDKTQRRRRLKKGLNSRARTLAGWDDLPDGCGRDVHLGMIDSGVDLKHPALKDQRITVKAVHSRKFRAAGQDHGTAVAALLVGKPGPKGWGGLLPRARLSVANIFGINDEGRTVGTAGSLLRGINWLVARKVHVVNIGITGADNRNVRRAMTVAQKHDLIVVAAVGNRGWRKKRAYPAAYFNTIAVTAIGAYRGVMKNANQGPYVDFAMPGERMWIAAPNGRGTYQSGSSFATPYVTALIGAEIANGSERDPDQLREILRRNADDLGKSGKDILYGWGFITKLPRC